MSREVHGTIIGVHDSATGGKPVPSKENVLNEASHDSEVLGVEAAIDTECYVDYSHSHYFGTVDGSTPFGYWLIRAGGKVG